MIWFEKTMFPEVALQNELEGLINNTFDTMSTTIIAGGLQVGMEERDDDMEADMEVDMSAI
jgi:hypothetical protein